MIIVLFYFVSSILEWELFEESQTLFEEWIVVENTK